MERLTSSQLSTIIQNYSTTQFLKNEAYYQASNKTLLEKNYSGTPDWRAPLPFGRRTVLDICGYAYKPGNVKYIFDNNENNEADVKLFEEILAQSNEELVSGEIFQDALVKGEGAELIYWEGGNALPKFVQIPREQCIFVYDDSVEKNLNYSIRYYISTIVNTLGNVENIHHADVYHEDRIDYYEFKEVSVGQTINPQIETQNTDTDKTKVAYAFKREEPHYFGYVPLYPYKINSDSFGIFQKSIRIIDVLDNISSDSIANSIDRFNDTILALSKKLDKDVVENLKEYRVMDGMGGKEEGNFVEYIQRNLNITGTVAGFELFERLYYELTGIPNIHSERFQNKSGVAILYALIPMENLVSTIEIYFTKGLQHRIKLINSVLNKNVAATVEWKRNLPVNLQEIIAEIVQLKNTGILSDETLLRMLPDSIVDDVEVELEKLAEQKQNNMEMFSTRFEEPKEDVSGDTDGREADIQ
jgi:SPP1 family phage portal protein